MADLAHDPGGDAKKKKKKGTGAPPPPPAPPQKKKSKTSYYQPVAELVSVQNQDEGQDYIGKPGSNVVAIGNAIIDGVYHNVKGFGTMIVYTLQTGKYAGHKIYVGHAVEVSGLHAGQIVNGGDAIAVLSTPPGSSAKTPGWVEVGIANDAGTGPKYKLPGDPHGPRTPGGLALKQLLGQALTPAEKSDVKAAQATADANNTSLIQATTDLAAAKAQAKAVQHISDPWVTVIKDAKGNTRFGIATGYNAPKNALTYAGQPVTKSELSSVWGSRYADTYEQYTGKVATPGMIASILSMGLSQPGLQQALAGGKLQSWNQFKKSPVYQQNAAAYNSAAMRVLGVNAPKSMLQQALAHKWDTTEFEQKLRNYQAPDGSRPYLGGPEFTNNYSALKSVYGKVYGAADENAEQAIKEAAGSGWDANAFGTYLRSQPEYTTSIEYQSNAVNFLDQMGLLLKMAPTLKVAPQTSGKGAAVPNSSLVPGAPAPLNNVLNTTPGLEKVGGKNG